jgi:chemotaxis protein CheD
MEAVSLVQGSNWSSAIGAEVSDSLYLLPGALYIGNEVQEVKTLLGSCVAITLWQPKDKVCGMTHIVLPSGRHDENNPKFATGAIQHLMQTIAKYGYQPKDFKTGVYGGGRMFGKGTEQGIIDVGNSNVKKTLALLGEAGFPVGEQDVQGSVYRHVLMDRSTGAVRIKRTEVSATMA